MKSLFLVLASLFISSSAFAVPVWNYRVDAGGPIKGGKLKIFQMSRSETVRQVRFKYKLQTVIGYKEDWIPYNLPAEAFSPNSLSTLDIGQSVALLDFTLARTGNKSFSMKGPDGRIDFITPTNFGGAWTKLVLKVKGVVINGTLMEVTDE